MLLEPVGDIDMDPLWRLTKSGVGSDGAVSPLVDMPILRRVSTSDGRGDRVFLDSESSLLAAVDMDGRPRGVGLTIPMLANCAST